MLLSGPSEKVLITRFVERKNRLLMALQISASSDAEFVMPSGVKKRNVSEEKKRKNLVVLAKTSRLKRFLFSKTFEQQR